MVSHRAAALTVLALIGTCGVVGSALEGTAHAQSDTDRAAARTAATAGLKAYNEGRFQDAVDLCTRAESLMHAPTHLLLIARSQAKLGHLVEAQEAYFRIKRDQLPANAPRAFVEAVASAADEQAALAPRIPTIKITLDGPAAKDVALTIDGQNESAAILGLPKPVNPGPHTISAHASNAESDTATVSVPEGAAQSVTLTMHATGPAEPSAGNVEPATEARPVESGGRSGLRTLGWVGFGVGAVGAAVGTIFVIKNHSDLNDANALCGASECPMSKKGQIDDLDSSAKNASTLAWVSYGVGLAGAGAGVVLFIMGGKSSAAPQAAGLAHARPWVGPGSAGFTLAF